jgi:aromatic ring-opening dioxygenase LigB subunit
MSKSVKKTKYAYDDDFESYDDYGYNQELQQRRKDKRIRSALKTKNIDRLLELDEDYD